jgi:hypothetical protein
MACAVRMRRMRQSMQAREGSASERAKAKAPHRFRAQRLRLLLRRAVEQLLAAHGHNLAMDTQQ